MLVITKPDTQQHYKYVRELFTEYWEWLQFEPCFQDFDKELATLPGRYADPGGCILLAFVESKPAKPAGCIAIRPIDKTVCEMKRLYVRSRFRGERIGWRLVETIIDEARERKYSHMRLDTLPIMEKAISIYEAFGFCETTAYSDDPTPGARFYELEL